MAATPPKVFISYSWSTPDHEAWVMDLAKNLTESGVDVVVDKWSLREGQDKYVFMEQMVSNPEIQKVIVLSDKVYAEKADDRKGGVGTESQIISPEIYKNTEQSKFVPIILERDDKGEPHLPTFLRGRMYIDMSNAANRYENFEQLIRWIFDKPIHQRPPIGKPPTYITNPDAISLGTTARFRTALDHLKTGSRLSAASVSDYLQTLATSVTRLRILYDPSPDAQLDDTIVAQIEMFKPYRDEYVELVNAFIRYGVESEVNDLLHEFWNNY